MPTQTPSATPGSKELVLIAKDHGVAIFRMQAPPVNALGSGLRLARRLLGAAAPIV